MRCGFDRANTVNTGRSTCAGNRAQQASGERFHIQAVAFGKLTHRHPA